MAKYKPVQDHEGRWFESAKDMCAHYNIPEHTYRNRLARGWTKKQALTVPNDSSKASKIKHRKPIQDHTGTWFPCVREMAEHWGITEKIYWSRKRILKWPLEKILTTPVRDKYDTTNAMPVTDHTGREFKSISAMCRHWGIRLSTYRERRKRGWPIGKALTGKEIQITTDAVPCRDHLGKPYPSKNAMCRAWGITRYCYDSRLALGWSQEKALATPHIVNAKPCTDHDGKEFPASIYMALYLGFPKHAFQNNKNPASRIPQMAGEYYKDRQCGKYKIKRCLGFPWFEACEDKASIVLHFDDILDEFHRTGFSPLPETKLKNPTVSAIKLVEWPWYLCEINGRLAVLDYDALINIHAASNFGSSNPDAV